MYWFITPGQDWNTARLGEASTWQHPQSQCHLPHSLQIHTNHPSFQPFTTVKVQGAMSFLHPCRKGRTQSLHTYTQHRQERLSYLSNCDHRGGEGRAGTESAAPFLTTHPAGCVHGIRRQRTGNLPGRHPCCTFPLPQRKIYHNLKQ